MIPRRVIGLAAALALGAAVPWSFLAGAAGVLGVFGGGAVGGGTFGWAGLRLAGTAKALARPGAPSPRALTAQALALTGIRWTLACFCLWGLLGHTHPLAVLTGLSCVPAAIWLLSLSALLRAPDEPSTGAPP